MMTPEQALLLRCAIPYPNTRQIEETAALVHADLDWEVITSQANNHGLSQLLFQKLKLIEGAEIPEAIEVKLRNRFDWAIKQNLLMTGELIRVVQLLAAAGITAVPFKGPVLAEKLYGNLVLRVFGDLDILIHSEDKEAVKSLLVKDGYTHYFHPDSVYQFVKVRPQIVLEIHWEAISFGVGWLRKQINKPLPTTLTHLSPRLRNSTLGGKAIKTLSPEDTLLILTAHGSKHWWSRLNWLSDIAALIHVYPELDWNWVLEQTNFWKMRRLVFLGLYLARKLLQAEIPENVWQQITAEPQLENLSQLVESMLFVEPNFYTRYIKRPFYFRQLWDTKDERRTIYKDHLALYLELFTTIFKKQPVSRK